jgi:hypothetical protein
MKILLAKVGEPMEVTDVQNELKPLQDVVGGNIEVLPIADDILMILNEEGKLEGLQSNFELYSKHGLVDLIVGNIFFVGYEGENFISLNDVQIDKIKQMFESRIKMIVK